MLSLAVASVIKPCTCGGTRPESAGLALVSTVNLETLQVNPRCALVHQRLFA
jgi:hypothetical protein